MKKRATISIFLTFAMTIAFYPVYFIRHNFKFDLFLIVLILSFLFCYKISNYLADFKVNKSASRLDIIMLTIFFAILFIPMSYIDKKDISTRENRTLAKLQPIFEKDKGINFSFGKSFESWFNDRFAGRNTMIVVYSKIKYNLSNGYNYVNGGVIDKKHKQLYTAINRKITEKELSTAFDNIYQLENFCNNNKIKFYVFIAPKKTMFYYPETSNGMRIEKNNTDFNNFVNKVKKSGRVNIIYPYDVMKTDIQKNNRFLYFKTDHHWTDDGAFIGYNELAKTLKQDFPEINIVHSKDFNYFYNKKIRTDSLRSFVLGNGCYKLGLTDKDCEDFLDVDYRYYKHKNQEKLKITFADDSTRFIRDYYYPNGVNLKVYLLGTSMNENLMEFLPYSFKNLRFISLNFLKNKNEKEYYKIMKYYKQDLLQYKPDILILSITYNNLAVLNDFFAKE